MNGGIHSWEMSGNAPFVIDVNMAFVFSVFRWWQCVCFSVNS